MEQINNEQNSEYESFNITDILNPEDIAHIEKIQEKISNYIKNNKNPEDLLEINPRNDMVHPNKVTDSPVEILFSLKATVTEVNDSGEPLSTIEVLDKFYHVPIINGTNYKMYVDNFLERFHNNLEQTCQELQNNE